MKSKFWPLTGCLPALTACLLSVPNPIQAHEIPEKYRETVHKGLEYLVKSQCSDGHWEGAGGQHSVSVTALAGLALFMEGGEIGPGRRRFRERKYAANIRKAVDWLVDKSQARREGLIFSEHPSETARYMEGHGWATLFLAGAFDNETIPERKTRLNEVLTRAVKYIGDAQSTQGGWYHTSKVEGHDFDAIAATAIQIQALQAAEHVGIEIPDDAINDGQEYLKMALRNYEEAGANRGRTADIAAALACRLNPFCKANDEFCKKWSKYCHTEIPVGRAIQFGRDELLHYYYAQAMFNLASDELTTWTGYRTAMFDHLQTTQNKDGSWPAPSSLGHFSDGPICSTALWCIVLQLDKQCHPSHILVPVLTK